jgi:hypothetical protein
MTQKIGRITAFRPKKCKDARTLAECVRAAKELVFVAGDGSEAMIGHDMRELMAEALDLLADQEQR